MSYKLQTYLLEIKIPSPLALQVAFDVWLPPFSTSLVFLCVRHVSCSRSRGLDRAFFQVSCFVCLVLSAKEDDHERAYLSQRIAGTSVTTNFQLTTANLFLVQKWLCRNDGRRKISLLLKTSH
ncbi:hypothetical protein TCAL_03212 [Tigriopus californicus]|uniref:Uncharacterized protein n=1 Tax=Tigriopus californicus TaxID=6832 RepID=A0A553NTU4_TIGCA|nr:hypothetical protein TCAL_03212 [Tigriopus californicus]|eukprot:TCALIF_03212-PA protein Name:"Protein of unknown function" AED:0.45 eAED:0.49 QI:0/1/0.66/1/0/0.33/3/329/122